MLIYFAADAPSVGEVGSGVIIALAIVERRLLYKFRGDDVYAATAA